MGLSPFPTTPPVYPTFDVQSEFVEATQTWHYHLRVNQRRVLTSEDQGLREFVDELHRVVAHTNAVGAMAGAVVQRFNLLEEMVRQFTGMDPAEFKRALNVLEALLNQKTAP